MSIDGPSLLSSGFQRYLPKAFQGCVISIQTGRRRFEKLVLKQFRKVDLKKSYSQHISDKKKGIHKMHRYDLALSYQFFVPDRKHFCLCIYPSLAIWFSLNGLFRMIQFSACPVWVSIGRVELQVVYSASERRLVSWWWESLRGVAAFRPFSMLVTWWWGAWLPPAKVPRLKGSLEAIDTWAPFISSTWCHITRLEESKLF